MPGARAPDARIPLDDDIDSGRFEMNTAASTATPTEPPSIRVRPITADSGMPSSTAPSSNAVLADALTAFESTELIRCSAPWFSTT